nr:MFS transporter [Verrucomicrobiota bacterium]
MPSSDIAPAAPVTEDGSKPTRVRYLLLVVATANAFLLYLDRICMGAVVQSPSFQRELGLGEEQIGDVLAAFFFAYALGQLPGGYLADRFGPRRMLVTYILLWSLCTAATGLVGGLMGLVAVRLACGLAEAGAYPASGRVITRWFPFGQRGRASSVVTFGGRIGNALALWLTAALIAALGSWRPVLWIYGALGLLLAAATWVVFRNDPASHPWTNEAERAHIRSGGPPPPPPDHRFPWRALLTHPGLWMISLGSIGHNLGWAFLITWLPTYLIKVRGLDPVTAGRFVSIALACGLAGVLFGGWWCDALTRWFGPRWGRRLPFVIGATVAASAYLLCPTLESAVGVAVAAAIVAFAGDSMIPAVWALGQDIGRNHVASTIAWSNMWGNFGAAAVSKLIPMVLATSFHRSDWSEIFWMCAGGFALQGVA